MSATINITESTLLTALRGFLLSVVGDSYEVVKGQDNRVAMPEGQFITMTGLNSDELNKPYSTWQDSGQPTGGLEHTNQAKKWICQIDVYGSGSSSVASTIATLVRSSYAVRQFAELTEGSDFSITPLFVDQPHQTTMINGEQQYEERWTLDLHLQYNAVISTPMEFAAELYVKPASVDASFPPEKL